MEKHAKRNIAVRINMEDYEKLRIIAKVEYRTISGQVFFWIRRCIREYEQTHGAMPPK